MLDFLWKNYKEVKILLKNQALGNLKLRNLVIRKGEKKTVEAEVQRSTVEEPDPELIYN